MLKKIPILRLESIEYFKYKRIAELEWLIEQARHHHYSTFYLYEKREFDKSLEEFQYNITQHFRNLNSIIWNDENTMFVISKTQGVKSALDSCSMEKL